MQHLCGYCVETKRKDYIVINPELPDFSSIFRNRHFEVCINATGAANVQLSFAYPALDYILNVANVYHILDGIRQNTPECKFINLSSAAVYGNPVSLPIRETNSVQPLSPYGFHKWYSSEQAKWQFHLLHHMNTVSLRIFSAYGEGLKKQLFWDLHQKVLKNSDSVELFGTGTESRDFIYVQDIMQAISCVIDNALFDGDVINVASGTESSIESVAGIFLKSLGRKANIKFRGKQVKRVILLTGGPIY